MPDHETRDCFQATACASVVASQHTPALFHAQFQSNAASSPSRKDAAPKKQRCVAVCGCFPVQQGASAPLHAHLGGQGQPSCDSTAFPLLSNTARLRGHGLMSLHDSALMARRYVPTKLVAAAFWRGARPCCTLPLARVLRAFSERTRAVSNTIPKKTALAMTQSIATPRNTAALLLALRACFCTQLSARVCAHVSSRADPPYTCLCAQLRALVRLST